MSESTRPVVHVLSQAGQPYGSERRCCNHCGVMIWEAHPDNCGANRGR